MTIELPIEVVIGLSASAVTITLASIGAVLYIYRRGEKKGIDDSCAKRIEKDVQDLREEMGEHETESDGAKTTLHKRIDGVETKINEVHLQLASMKGAQETFQAFVREKL